MTTLYLDRSGTILEASGEVLELRDATGRLERRIPIKFLERVVMRARCYFDSSTLANLVSHEVPVLILDGRAGRRLAHWVGAPHNDARRRWGQILTLAEPDAPATLARAFVHAKIRRQRRTLMVIGSARPDLRKPLWDASQTLQTIERRLHDDPALPLDTLRGCEGAAAAAYFPAFFQAFPPRIRPSARNRRPPRDPVNAALSLGYTLLYGLAVNACWSAGLDPAIGALHAPAHGRAALACDLVEPLRGQIDEWTWQLFRRELLRPEHFGVEGSGACLLGKAGRAVFWREWEWRSRRWQRLLERYAQHLAREFARHTPVFDLLDDWESS